MYVIKTNDMYILSVKNYIIEEYNEYNNEEEAYQNLARVRDFIYISLILKKRLNKKDKKIIYDIIKCNKKLHERDIINNYLSKFGFTLSSIY